MHPDPHMSAVSSPASWARFSKAPTAITAGRVYRKANVDACQGLEALGVKKVVIRRRGKSGAARKGQQQALQFPEAVKWRTISEARSPP